MWGVEDGAPRCCRIPLLAQASQSPATIFMNGSANGAVAVATEHLYDILPRPTVTAVQSAGRLDVAPATNMDSVLIIAVAVVVVVILLVFVRARRRK